MQIENRARPIADGDANAGTITQLIAVSQNLGAAYQSGVQLSAKQQVAEPRWSFIDQSQAFGASPPSKAGIKRPRVQESHQTKAHAGSVVERFGP